MSITPRELIARLEEVPDGWLVYATKAGGSLEVWEPNGNRYGYVFTDERPPRYLTSRRPEPAALNPAGRPLAN